MKLTVKTLKGSKFVVECEPSQTVSEVKGAIESTHADLPASTMKLIHSGKVLKDEVSIESCGIKQNDFLVVMVTKAKKTAAKAPAPAPASTEAKPKEEAKAPASDSAMKPSPSEENKASEPETSSSVTNVASSTSAPTSNADVTANNTPELSAEAVNSLTAMGFPEAEVRHCLRAAQGNPDIAVEFLTNGIPPGMQPGEQAGATGSTSSSASSGGILAGLRNHPQFNDLRRLVQSNPAMLQRVLTQIGQQQPDLLTEINANQEAFLQMMNEPVTEASTSTSGVSSNSGSTSQSSPSSGGGTEMQGIPPGFFMDGMTNPAQMAQLIQNMSPSELNQMATMMGFSSEQLRSTAQMLGQIPPEQLQQYMMQAMQGGGSGGMGGTMGGGGGPQVLRLTEEEMAAVNRLADLGFDRTEAAQAYLACDKNEALAANLLMDSMGDEDFGGGFGGSSADGGNSNGDDGDDMYD